MSENTENNEGQEKKEESLTEKKEEMKYSEPSGVKSLGNDRIGGFLITFGNSIEKDLQGEYFTKDTDINPDWFEKRPVLYHHGLDKRIKTDVVGIIDRLEKRAEGWWAEAQLILRNKYVDKIRQLVSDGALHWSSGTLPHLATIAPDGRIKAWPLVEGSLTPTPAEPRRTNINFIKSAFEGAGLKYFDLDSEKESENEENKEENIAGELKTKLSNSDKELHINITNNLPHVGYKGEPEGSAEGDSAQGQESEENTQETQENEEKQTVDHNKKENLMEEQLNSFVKRVAENKGFTINADNVADISGKIKAYLSEKIGSEDVDLTHLKLALGDQSFNEQINVWMKSYTKSDSIEDLADQFTSSDQGKNGKMKFSPAAGDASNNGAPLYIKDRALKLHYDKMGPADKAFYYDMRARLARAKSSSTWEPPAFFFESLHDGAQEYIDKHGINMATANEDNRRMDDVPLAVKAIDAIGQMKAKGMKSVVDNSDGAINYSTRQGFGDEWVPHFWQGELWTLVQGESDVASEFQVIDMPSNPYTLPLQGDDPEIYTAPETTNESQFTNTGPIPGEVIPTGNMSFEAHKLGARAYLSAEMEEDSIIQFIPNMRMQQLRSMQNGIDFVLLNADATDGANNIADWGRNQSSGNTDAYNAGGYDSNASKRRWQLGFDGVLHRPLVDNTAQKLDAGNQFPTFERLRKMIGMIDDRYMNMANDMVMFVDPGTHHSMKSIEKLLDAQTYTNQFTNQVTSFDGVRIKVTYQLGKGDEDGYINATTANNTQGRALLVYKPYYKMGFRRQLQTWIKYDEVYDAYQAGHWIRIAFLRRDWPVRESCALMYNIKI